MKSFTWRCLLVGCFAYALSSLAPAQPATNSRASPQEAALQAAAALYDGIRTETLPNGLRVYLKPIPGSPVVTTKVAYKVGAADEDLNHTGLSHYLEHLMFKGTDKLLPGDIDRITLRNGGANNAYTSDDYTVFHFDFAADRWEAALEIEADRMRNLRIDARHEFEQEKGAVVAELERNEDEPWDLEYKTLAPLLFGKTAPYGHPVIGEREHVRKATAEIIKGHYDKWYHPNNAALVICGGFESDRAMARIKELFGPIPAGKLPPRNRLPDEKLKRPARQEFESKFDVPRMLLAFNGIGSDHPDRYALEVAQGVLSGGKTSRLYRKLVEGEEIASSVSSSNSAGRYPGFFLIQVELLKGKDRQRTEKLVLDELKRLRDEPVSAAELKRVQQGLLAGMVFARESVHGLADSIARGVTTNDLDFLKNYLPRLVAVTAEDVQRVARKYFDPEQRVVVWSVPKERPKRDGQGGGRSPTSPPPSPLRRGGLGGQVARHLGQLGNLPLKDARRVELPNGLVLLLLENHRLPIIVAEASVRHVRLLEPEDKLGVATLTGYLLDEGTSKHTGQQIAELIEDAGGSLEMSSSGGSVQVLTPHRKLGLELLFECLTQSNFPKDAFNRYREQLLSEIDEAEFLPESKARQVFRELAYGKHPFARPSLGRRKTVEALTPEDCAAFHRLLFVPSNTVVAIVGDFDSKEVIEEITQLTANWKMALITNPQTAPVEKPKEQIQKIVTMPQAAQLHFYLGHAGIRRNNPDYHKLLVMDHVLGTGPGFTDRLSARLRDREGLAYTVFAHVALSAAEEPGLFFGYIGTEPRNFARVKQMFLEELNRIRDEKPKLEEVEDAKKYLLGSLPFRFTTNSSLADQLLYLERHRLGFDYYEQYRQAITAVTPEDIQTVARKYIDPERLILVAAGPLDEKGKPVGK